MLSEHNWRLPDGETRAKIKKVVRHPKYDRITEYKIPVYDFALIELEVSYSKNFAQWFSHFNPSNALKNNKNQKKHFFHHDDRISCLPGQDPLVFSSSLRPICLPSERGEAFEGRTATAAGWGDSKSSLFFLLNYSKTNPIAGQTNPNNTWYPDLYDGA